MKAADANILSADTPLIEAMRQLNDVRYKILFVTDERKHLQGTLTDGDIRRALLRSPPLTLPVREAMNTAPIVARVAEDRERLAPVLREKLIRYLPRVDADGILMGLYDILDEHDDEVIVRPNMVLLMAGGLGTRLAPLTATCPKPMLSVGGQPILETIIRNCAAQGLRRFCVSLNYMADVITDYFGTGERWGVEIEYLRETERSGTAGALSLLRERPSHPFVVMNGDVLTQIDFRSLLSFHTEHGASATMCVREYDMQVPYGTVEVEGVDTVSLQEKPVFRFFVNAGIYCLDPVVLDYVHPGWLDMPDLLNRLMAEKRRVTSFPIHEYWLDIGRLDDYERAQTDYKTLFAQEST